MNECLVTKLKGTVDNPSLLKLGEIVFTVIPLESISNPSDQQRFNWNTNKEVIITPLDGGYFADSVADLSDVSKRITQAKTYAAGTHIIYVPNTAMRFSLISKYGLGSLNLGGTDSLRTVIGMNIDDLKYLERLTNLTAFMNYTGIVGSVENLPINAQNIIIANSRMITGDISKIRSTQLREFNFLNTKVSGDIAFFGTKNKGVTSLNSHGSQVTGTFDSLGPCTALTRISFWNTGVTGTIEGFVAGQCNASSNPRTSYTQGITCFRLFGFATLGGKDYGLTMNNYNYLCWESASKIYVLIGSQTTPTKVVCKGYTVEEAASKWPGVTVVRAED